MSDRRYITSEIRQRVYERDDFHCSYCGERVFRNIPQGHYLRATIDHVRPLYLNGSNELSNLVTACFRCNRTKWKSIWNVAEVVPAYKTMTKKAVIQNLTKKEFNDQYKNWSYGVKFDNGDEGFLSCKKEFFGGEEIEYEIEEATSKAGKPYNKIKLPGSGNGFQKGFGASRGSNESFALSYAKDTVVAMMTGGLIQGSVSSTDITKVVCTVADSYLNWLNEHKS